MADLLGGTLKLRPKPQKESGEALVRQPRSFSISCLADQLQLDNHACADLARMRDKCLAEVNAWLDRANERYGRRGRA